MRLGENEALSSQSCVAEDPHVTQELDVPVMVAGTKVWRLRPGWVLCACVWLWKSHSWEIVDREKPVEAEGSPLDEGERTDVDVLLIQSEWDVDVEG